MITSIDARSRFADSHARSTDPTVLRWLDELPTLLRTTLERWSLRPDGPLANGMAGLLVPVRRADGRPAALKLQPVVEDNAGIAPGLRAWDGDGIVRLIDHHRPTGAYLLERLHNRTLATVTDDDEATAVLADLLARLTAHQAPEGMRRLADIAAAMLTDLPDALPRLADPAERDLLRACASAVADLLPDAGDRLLHWDLHHDNVLAADREPWLAIDPEPLAGDPGFDLLPTLDNQWDRIAASGDVPGAVLRRFDLLTDRMALDRSRAAGWTLGRVLQNSLWDVEDGKTALDPVQVAIATTLIARHA